MHLSLGQMTNQRLKLGMGASEIWVMDAVGPVMARVDLPAGTGRFTLRTNELRAGMYFEQVSSEAGVEVVPVVVLR